MPFNENPPEHERTRADRLSDAPMLLWAALAVVVILGFIGLLVLFHYHGL